MSLRSNEEWVRALRQNDEAAWRELWDKICQWCDYFVIHRYHLDDETADKAKFETFKRIQQRIATLEITISLFGFCREIAHNESLRAISGELKRQKRELPWEDNSDAKSDQLIDLSLLEPCLSQLRELERNVLELYYADELEYLEIAEILDIRQNHAYQLHFRALRKLKECLIAHGYPNAESFLLY